MICMYEGDDYEGQRKGVLLSAAVFLQRSYNDGYKIDENKKQRDRLWTSMASKILR